MLETLEQPKNIPDSRAPIVDMAGRNALKSMKFRPLDERLGASKSSAAAHREELLDEIARRNPQAAAAVRQNIHNLDQGMH